MKYKYLKKNQRKIAYKYSNKEKFNKKYIKYKVLYTKINDILSTLLFCLSYYLYYLSLEPCFSGVDTCGNNVKWIFMKVFQLSSACIILSILFLLIIFNVITKLHIFHFIPFFIYFYITRNGISFKDHGFFNFIAFFLIFILTVLIGVITKVFVSFISNINSYRIQKFTEIFLLVLLYLYSFDPMNCSDWGKGLNNTFIEDNINKYGCRIQFPKKCPYKIFKYFQDFTKLIHLNCSSSKKNNREIILKKSKSKYITNITKRFGFPLTNKGLIGRLDGVDDVLIYNFVLNNLFDIDNKTLNENETELILDFTKDNLGEYIIDLKYNETLSKERKALENKVSPYSNNIIVIFIDSVSRGNSIRQLKKTLSFFENFMKYSGGYNPKYTNEKYHSFQFFKYHAFKNNTSGNFPRLFYGVDRSSEKIVLLTKFFKENGFITNYNSDACQKDNIRTFHNLTENEVYDHQFLLCDPNIYSYLSPYKKCLHGKTNIEYLCEYSNQFWRKYNQNRKLSVIISNDGHEGTLEALKYTDIILYNYLNSLFHDNLLKDSSIILLSDHGVVMPSVYGAYDFYSKEMGLPMLYLLINDRKNINYIEQYFYLHENQQILITAFDIYNTIIHLLYGDEYITIKTKESQLEAPKSHLGQSLFTNISKKNRTTINLELLKYILCV